MNEFYCSNRKETIYELGKRTPVCDKYDVIVAGGGIAGIAAALAAARNGAKTLLAERQFILGGLSTAGLVTIFLPLCDGIGHQVSFGIAEELLKLSIQHGCETNYPKAWLENGSPEEKCRDRYQTQYNANIFAILLEQLLISEGVTILYGSLIVDAIVQNQSVTHIIVENISGRQAYITESIIDATGDAVICEKCSVPTRLFSQGNNLAAWYYVSENNMISLRMLGCAKRADEAVYKIDDKRYSGLDVHELTDMVILSHAETIKDYLKFGGVRKERALTAIATIPQIRMTRCLRGAYTVDIHEEHKSFPDSVGMFSNWRKCGPVYELPFGSLYCKKIKNLLAVGRCISVTDAMWDISRVIPACAVSGEAAGTAAAICSDFTAIDLKRLQKQLQKQGVKIHNKE